MNKNVRVETGMTSLKKALIFLVAVILLLGISFLMKLVSVLQQSTFDGKQRFTVAVSENPGNSVIYSIDPVQRTFSQVTIEGKKKAHSPGRTLGIPIDATVQLKPGIDIDKNPRNMLIKILLQQKENSTHITSVDVLRMLFTMQSIKQQDFTETSVAVSKPASEIDEIAIKLFTDQTFLQEKTSIQIVNGTNVEGLGRRLERILKNAGCNVISIVSSDQKGIRSKILYYGKSSYTQTKLAKILKYPVAESETREIADIIILIGEDGIRETVF